MPRTPTPGLLAVGALAILLPSIGGGAPLDAQESPYLLVLGVAQDGGVPQTGSGEHPGWDDPERRRLATSLALVDPGSGQRWLFDATPDIRAQLRSLDEAAPSVERPGIDGIFLTHGHVGHYLGLAHFGHEVMGADRIPVWGMPRMRDFLSTNGPWDQLVRYRNIELRELADGVPVALTEELSVTPFLVPHRQEYTEVVGFRIDGPRRSFLFLPDIDSWEEWDELGTRIEKRIAEVDLAYVDGTFFADGELGDRDMSGFPHPFIAHSMERFADLPAAERAKVVFIHLNHSNPAHWLESQERARIEAAGFRVAVEGEREEL
jgi:pyrroloquinoline quinone biosynthesis protein B